MTVKVLKFQATWCGPCQALAKIMVGLDEVEVESIDIDEQPERAAEFQIRGVPTLVYMKDGKEVKRATGVLKLATIKETVEGLK